MELNKRVKEIEDIDCVDKVDVLDHDEGKQLNVILYASFSKKDFESMTSSYDWGVYNLGSEEKNTIGDMSRTVVKLLVT